MGHGLVVVAHDVADEHHLGKPLPLALGAVAHGPQVALIEVLQAGQLRATRTCIEVVLDLDNRRHGILGVAKEFQADGSNVLGHSVQDPTAARDQAIAAFLLNAGQPAEHLVGDILAQAKPTKAMALDAKALYRDGIAHEAGGIALGPNGLGELIGTIARNLKLGPVSIVDLAHVVADAGDLEPLAVWVHHAPGGEVVNRRTPEHGLLAARVHGNVAAHAGGIGRGGVDCKDQACSIGGIRDAAGHHASTRKNGGHRRLKAGQCAGFHGAQALEFLGVDDHRSRRERNGSAGVASATAARNDGEAQLNAGLHQGRHLSLGVGHQHHKGVLHTPVGGIGDMRDPREAIKPNVVGCGVARKALGHPVAQAGRVLKGLGKACDSGAGQRQQPVHAAVSLGGLGVGGIARTTLVDLGEAMVKGADELRPPAGVLQQVVL